MSTEKCSLSWKNFGTSAENTLRKLFDDKDFTDVTLISSDMKRIKAHKVIISSCSQFFNQILVESPNQHPLLFLKDIRYCDLLSILNFIYIGQAEVLNEDLNRFMEAASVLQIEGLKPVDDANQYVSSFKTEDVHEAVSIPSYTSDNDLALLESSSSFHYSNTDSGTNFDSQVLNIDASSYNKYACDRCEYQTKNAGHLKAHILGKHEGVKFQCDQCDRQFTSKTNLQAHRYSKHDGRIYSCGECRFEAKDTTGMSHHKAKMHKQDLY